MQVLPRTMTDVRAPVVGTAVARPGQIKPLTSVRAFAALYVAGYHMVHPWSLYGPFAGLMSAGYVAVSFFFVLSGFILTYTYAGEYAAGRGDAARFWMARVARMYPVYLLATLLAGAIYHTEFRPAFHAFAFVADLLMVQSWSIRMAPFFNVPGWSLCVEAFFYLLFPFLLLRVRPRSRGAALAWFTGMWLLAMVAPMAGLAFDRAGAWDVHAGGNHRVVYAITRYPFFALPEFLGGMVLGWWHLLFPMGRRLTAGLLALGAGGSVLVLWNAPRVPYLLLHNGLLLPLFGMVILGLCGGGMVARLLSWGPLMLLGEASFALYLIHYLVNDFLQGYCGMPESLAGLVPRLLLTIPLSIALHLWVERPGRRMILSWWARRREAAALGRRAVQV